MAADDSLAKTILYEVLDHKLPLEILGTLSQSQPNVCKRHFERIAAFLDSDNRRWQEAGIRALGDDWSEYRLAEEKLRPFFQSEDVSLRDEAVRALRNLQTRKIENERIDNIAG